MILRLILSFIHKEENRWSVLTRQRLHYSKQIKNMDSSLQNGCHEKNAAFRSTKNHLMLSYDMLSLGICKYNFLLFEAKSTFFCLSLETIHWKLKHKNRNKNKHQWLLPFPTNSSGCRLIPLSTEQLLLSDVILWWNSADADDVFLSSLGL